MNQGLQNYLYEIFMPLPLTFEEYFEGERSAYPESFRSRQPLTFPATISQCEAWEVLLLHSPPSPFVEHYAFFQSAL